MTVGASIVTIGDEILIGQIVDTNSSMISRRLGEIGVKTLDMISIPDDREQIITRLSEQLTRSSVVISTGGLGPTKDDITKDALRTLFGSARYVRHEGQEQEVRRILHSRGLDALEVNLAQLINPSPPSSSKVFKGLLGTIIEIPFFLITPPSTTVAYLIKSIAVSLSNGLSL